jgi:hypothetical protein
VVCHIFFNDAHAIKPRLVYLVHREGPNDVLDIAHHSLYDNSPQRTLPWAR